MAKTAGTVYRTAPTATRFSCSEARQHRDRQSVNQSMGHWWELTSTSTTASNVHWARSTFQPLVLFCEQK